MKISSKAEKLLNSYHHHFTIPKMCAPNETPLSPSMKKDDNIVPQDNNNFRLAFIQMAYERLQQLQLRLHALNGIENDELESFRQDVTISESILNSHARHFGYFDEQ